MSDPFVEIYEITDSEGNKHRIYPMKLKDRVEVVRLMSKINDSIIYANFIIPKFNEDGSVKLNENGEIEYDDEPCEALLKLAEIATKQTRKQLLEWLDVYSATKLIEKFLNISQLKKKMMAE